MNYIQHATALVSVNWRRSTRSGPNGGACVEVGTVPELSGMAWRKSSRSGQGGGNCVEVGVGGSVIGVRDSKEPSGPALLFPAPRWADFLTTLRRS